MINRIAGRLFRLSNITTLNHFWASDNFRSGGKGGKGSFFGKKDRQKEERTPYQPAEKEEPKESHHKTVRFLKKHELKMKDIEPQPKRQLRFRKKETYDQGETEKPAPFVKSEYEENEQQLIKKSIFFTQSSQSAPPPPRQDRKDFSYQQPQLNQFLTSPPPQNKFYDKLSEDLDRIFALFESKNWKELNQIVQNYHQYTPAQDIEKELHTLLINADVSSYVEWLRNVGRGFKDLSDPTLRRLYNGLVSQYKTTELKELLAFFKSRHFNVEYKSIGIYLSDIEKESPLKGLEQKVNERIDVILDILAVQLKYNQKNEASKNAVIYTLDEWFSNLAHLALDRRVGKTKFIALFEEIFIRQYEYIKLEHIYASGLFLNIIQNFYFGSYVTTAKLQSIFTDSIHSNDFEFQMVKLRDRLTTYRTKTGKFAFPNARRLLDQFQRYFAKEKFEPTLFYFVLLGSSNETRDINSLMEKRRILVNFAQHQYEVRELLNDPLWTLDGEQLKSKQIEHPEESPADVEDISKVAVAEEQQEQQGQTQEQQQAKQQGQEQQQQQQQHQQEQKTSTFQKQSSKQSDQQSEDLQKIGKKMSWSEFQFKKNRKQLGPVRLGWENYKKFGSYFSMIKQQIQSEGNPYRKQLLENVIMAKLNLQTDQNIVYLNGSIFSQPTGIEALDAIILKENELEEQRMENEDASEDQGLEEEEENGEYAQGEAVDEDEEADVEADVEAEGEEGEVLEIKGQQQEQGQEEQGQEEVEEEEVEEQMVIEEEGKEDIQEEDEGERGYMQASREGEQQEQGEQEESQWMQFDDEGNPIYEYEQQQMDFQNDQQYYEWRAEHDVDYDMNQMNMELFEYHNLLAVKSAIKLKKYELAMGLCEKIFMEPLIIQRTTKNVSMAVKSFLIEENAACKIPHIEDILEQVDKAAYRLPEDFLRSVYNRCDSFDELIWSYVPQESVKFVYWRTALAMDRGQELIRMDISGKLKNMQYQPEHDTLPVRERDEFIKGKGANWREDLMAELGIMRPFMDDTQKTKLAVGDNAKEELQQYVRESLVPEEDEELFHQVLAENGLLDQEALAEQGEPAEEGEAAEGEAAEGEVAQGEVTAAEGEVAQGEVAEGEVEAQGEAVAQGEVATEAVEESVAGEGEEKAGEQFAEQTVAEESAASVGEESVEASEEVTGQQRWQRQGQQKREQQNRQGQNRQLDMYGQPRWPGQYGYKEEETESQQIELPPSEDEDVLAQKILFGPSNFDASAGVRVKGYDFTSFLDLARRKIKPTLEEQYEQEKEYKKHVINLHSLTEQSRLLDVHYLQKKLQEYQRHVKSLNNIAIFMSFGLWNYDFVQYSLEPNMARGGAKDFREKFFNFCKYDGKKGSGTPDIILDNEKFIDINDRVEMATTLKFTEAMIDDLLIRRMRFFKEAEAVVKLPPSPVVEELILWGLRSDEPMGIYLGEKIAMLTNQVISHEVATQVGNYLSHRRQVPAERVERCKDALKVVGRINREHIYDFHQEYQHITRRKHFADYLQKRTAELDSSALGFLSRLDPTHAQQPETLNLTANLSRGKLVV